MNPVPITKSFVHLLVLLILCTEILWKWVPSYKSYMRILWMSMGGLPGILLLTLGESDTVSDRIIALLISVAGFALFSLMYVWYARLRRVEV